MDEEVGGVGLQGLIIELKTLGKHGGCDERKMFPRDSPGALKR